MASGVQFELHDADSSSQNCFVRITSVPDRGNLAYSETYSSEQGANGVVAAVKAGRATYHCFPGSDGRYYFHLKSTNGVDILFRSSHSYATQSGAEADMQKVRREVPNAEYFDMRRAGSRR